MLKKSPCPTSSALSKTGKNELKLPLGAPDTFFISAQGERLTECNPEGLEQCFALVVIVFSGKCNMSGDSGAGTEAVEEMLKEVCR
jgi:hypothetical protein